jgi:hypothetical protein
MELHKMIECWAKPSPAQAVCLLDALYNDEFLRFYAVTCLEDFKDEELRLYLLPLTQALLFEADHSVRIVSIESYCRVFN